MVFNATFNYISIISWRSILLVEYPEKTTDLSEVTGFELAMLVVIGTDCTCSCKSNYHTIITTTATSLCGMFSFTEC